jgi:hypothetical protein
MVEKSIVSSFSFQVDIFLITVQVRGKHGGFSTPEEITNRQAKNLFFYHLQDLPLLRSF